MKCQLCGTEFEKSESACEKCIFHAKDCNMVKCPNCGYKFIEDTKITSWLKNIFKIKGDKQC